MAGQAGGRRWLSGTSELANVVGRKLITGLLLAGAWLLGPGAALAPQTAQAEAAPPSHRSLTWHPYLAASFGTRLGARALPPGDPAAAEVGEGVYLRAGVAGGDGRLCGEVAAALDATAVPFRAPGASSMPDWDPEALGLESPARLRARLERAWVGYGSGLPCRREPWPDAARGETAWQAWVGWRDLGFGTGTGLLDLPRDPGFLQVGGEVRWAWGAYRKVGGRLGSGQRWLLGQQLWIGPLATRWGSVGLSAYELAVTSGRFAVVPVNWLPLWPAYLSQHLHLGETGNDDANFYMGAGLRVDRLFGGDARLEAEVLVDDMPQLPWIPQVYQLGGRLALTFQERWRVRYTRVHNFVVTFQAPSLSFVDQGHLLGYPDGPDADSLAVQWVGRPGAPVESAGVEWRRRGEGRIGDVWEPAYGGQGLAYGREHEFLSGVVEHSLRLRATFGLPGEWRLTAEAGPVFNTANHPGVTSVYVGLGLTGALPAWR
ncbi:MAG: hypothetical protein IMX02_12070 [Limnochordaceae bacterium]|nr:hypothetical protein [Limnochordaceae bacterium]